MNPKNSYKNILKTNFIFGGTQVFQIGIIILRAKFIAVLLGPVGMGITTMLQSTIDLITSLSSLNIGTSALKEIASAEAQKNEFEVLKKIKIFRSLVMLLGTIGSLVTLIFAEFLSEFSFSSKEYTSTFRWISVIIILTSISSSQDTLLRAFRKVKEMSLVKLFGSFVGTIFTLPLFYLWGINAIVPCLIISSLIVFSIGYLFVRKLGYNTKKININLLSDGSQMLKLGMALSLNGILSMFSAYFLKIYIARKGGVEEVGLFNAGFNLVNGYLGMVFTAISMDYFPRLVENINDDVQSKKLVNNQAEIALLFIAPLIVILINFIYFILQLLLSAKFVGVGTMVQYILLGTLFKAVSWPVAYFFLAKPSSKIYLFGEIVALAYTLILNIVFYHYFGITGLGVSFFLVYLIYTIQTLVLAYKYFSFKYEINFHKILLFQGLLVILSLSFQLFIKNSISIYLSFIMALISIIYSFVQLNDRLGLRDFFLKKLAFKK